MSLSLDPRPVHVGAIHRKHGLKNPYKARAPSFDAQAIQITIERALQSAGLDTRAGPMQGVTETIRRALSAGRLDALADAAAAADVVEAAEVADVAEARPRPGSFEAHVFSNGAGRRRYKVYVPAGAFDAPPAVIVMLHGCTQSADDFAAGTQMNRHADAHGFLVVYPEQAADANASKCWNWFQPKDQLRGTGEASLIAGIASAVADRQGADPRRVFVAGLSAGAAMAVVMGETYPDVFTGVGVHSGLPYGSAHDIPSALAAMKGGRSGLPGLKQAGLAAGARRAKSVHATQAVPLIVFHGDRDHTVQQANAAQIVQQARDAHAGDATLKVTTSSGVAPGGRRFSRSVDTDSHGQTRIESWTVHGAGHAWSGGHASGSYTDSAGPDASAEMVRFFLALPRAGVVA
jgi:poly(hydroxyalkanoate) depolymerase family esterase